MEEIINKLEIEEIGYIETDFKEKFGIPRQSSLVKNARGLILFNKKYRDKDAIRGLDEYTYLWVLWLFDVELKEQFVPLVRPPKLGGNEYKGVFATRSPFRPNRIAMSSLRIGRIYEDYEYPDKSTGPAIEVLGVDILNGTRIIDIKPYLEYADSHVMAGNGFASDGSDGRLSVCINKEDRDRLEEILGEENTRNVIEIISLDPRPSYHNDPDRIYGFKYMEWNIQFKVIGKEAHVIF